MTHKEVVAFAEKQGYDDVLPLGRWKEYDAYEPIFDDTDDENPAMVGPPLIILVKGDTIRMSTEEEAFEQMEQE